MSYKILLVPLWMLSMSFAAYCVIIGCAWDDVGKLVWAVCWTLANSIPVFTLMQAYEKERFKRMEIEKRWRKEAKENFQD